MSKREIAALAKILTDPQNESRSAEEVAQLVIDELDDVRARTHRLAVVGQIRYGPQEPTHTVVLGPFSARGILDTAEKFERVTAGPVAAREAGGHLAWDAKTGTGTGRFMFAPAFFKPRDAWDFFRPPKDESGAPMNMFLPPPRHIAETVAGWKPGLWAEEHNARP